jgi:hypothetical protein
LKLQCIFDDVWFWYGFQRLVQFGLPQEQLYQPGLVALVREEGGDRQDNIVSVILPADPQLEGVSQDSKLGLKTTF